MNLKAKRAKDRKKMEGALPSMSKTPIMVMLAHKRLAEHYLKRGAP